MLKLLREFINQTGFAVQSLVLLAVFWAARPQNPLSLWGQKTFFVLILSWEARFPWNNGTSCWFHQSWVILAVFWVARPQNPLSVWGHKTFIVLILDRRDIWPTQHPDFGSKLSSEGKPGTCALLETLQSPVVFFRRAKFLRLLHKFCILPAYFCKYWWFVYRHWWRSV